MPGLGARGAAGAGPSSIWEVTRASRALPPHSALSFRGFAACAAGTGPAQGQGSVGADGELERVQQALLELEPQVKRVEAQVERVEEQVEQARQAGDEREAALRQKEDRLREKERQLREEKRQLRQKEDLLRRERRRSLSEGALDASAQLTFRVEVGDHEETVDIELASQARFDKWLGGSKMWLRSNADKQYVRAISTLEKALTAQAQAEATGTHLFLDESLSQPRASSCRRPRR